MSPVLSFSVAGAVVTLQEKGFSCSFWPLWAVWMWEQTIKPAPAMCAKHGPWVTFQPWLGGNFLYDPLNTKISASKASQTAQTSWLPSVSICTGACSQESPHLTALTTSAGPIMFCLFPHGFYLTWPAISATPPTQPPPQDMSRVPACFLVALGGFASFSISYCGPTFAWTNFTTLQ